MFVKPNTSVCVFPSSIKLTEELMCKDGLCAAVAASTVFRPDRVAFSGVLPVTVGMLSFGEFHITLGFVRLDYGDCGLVGPRNWFVCKNPSRLGDPCASGELGTSVSIPNGEVTSPIAAEEVLKSDGLPVALLW